MQRPPLRLAFLGWLTSPALALQELLLPESGQTYALWRTRLC